MAQIAKAMKEAAIIYNALPRVKILAQQVANRMEQQQCLLANEFGGIDIRPLKHVIVVNNPNLLMIVEPYFDPVLEVRTLNIEFMQKNDYINFRKFNKLTGAH